MNCPKCQGGTYLADEDLVKASESSSPPWVLIKQTFVCRACADRFSRIVSDDVASRRVPQASQSSGAQPLPFESVYSPQRLKTHEKEPEEKIKFLD
jgi:hypothetical protein